MNFTRALSIEVAGQEIQEGDRVRVLNPIGSRERYMRGTFTFVAHVTNDKGSSWVDVFGGKDHHDARKSERKARSFPTDRIEPLRKGARRRVSSS